MKWIRRILVIFVVLLAIFIVGITAFCILSDQKKKDLPIPAAEDGNTLDARDDSLLFLLCGVDHTGDGSVTRTDTLMLMQLDFQTNRITALSIPRDTRCYVDGELDKINHAHAYGGIDLTMRTVRDFLGLDIDYYMEIDFETVEALVDAGGGVRYTVPEDAAPVKGEIFTVGEQVMDGKTALSFLRHRQGYALGDLGRVNAQQAFFKEMLRQLASPGNLLRYPLMIKAFDDHAQTNIPYTPLLARIFSLIQMRANSIDWYTIPGDGEMIDGISYYVVDSEGTLDLVRELFPDYVLGDGSVEEDGDEPVDEDEEE